MVFVALAVEHIKATNAKPGKFPAFLWVTFQLRPLFTLKLRMDNNALFITSN
jgi:hypothetical protein